MIVALTWNWALDGWIIVVGSLCAVASAVLGNFLVLRKLSMLGDAVTHAVLPGIAAAFLISHSRSSLPMFMGAVIVGVLTALFTEWIRGIGKVDEGASMGVVFTSLFALGLVMLVQAADKVHLDADCVLYGAIELTPLDTIQVFQSNVPRAAIVLAIVAATNILFVVFFFKELKISSFDPALSTTMGFPAKLMHYALMVLVSVTAVASFESVGSILVVAMFVVPAAAAYLLTDRLAVMVVLSALIGVAAAVIGHIGALIVPAWFNFDSTRTSGMMAVAAGLLFVLAAFFSPRHGVVVKFVRRWILSMRILCDDIVALLYRHEERSSGQATQGQLSQQLIAKRLPLAAALTFLRKTGEIDLVNDVYRLTESGRDHARQLIRSHRLWEQYLVVEANAEAGSIHDKAEKFEHFTGRQLRDKLDKVTEAPGLDPHGKPIPLEKDGAQ